MILYQSNAYTGCTGGDIRLVEGASKLEGRVEVCVDSEWNTVCDNGFGNVDAKVVCRQLEYSSIGTHSFFLFSHNH